MLSVVVVCEELLLGDIVVVDGELLVSVVVDEEVLLSVVVGLLLFVVGVFVDGGFMLFCDDVLLDSICGSGGGVIVLFVDGLAGCGEGTVLLVVGPT